MAGRAEVVVAGIPPQQASQEMERAIAEVRRIEAKYSRYRAESIVGRINAAAGISAVECDDETWALMAHADHLHVHSQGFFDITSGVLRRAWDFQGGRIPDQAEVQALLPLVGWDKVERSAQAVSLLHAGMEIDFGGIGKEYAADRAGALLMEHGVRHGYVNLAGDIRVMGPKPDGEPWVIGIQHPRATGAVLATLALSGGGIATSGDYERFFEVDGRRYCHLLNPFTGWPVDYWQCVSVQAPIATLAGNCCTIAMLMEEQGREFLESTGLEFLAVDRHGTTHVRGALHRPAADAR